MNTAPGRFNLRILLSTTGGAVVPVSMKVKNNLLNLHNPQEI